MQEIITVTALTIASVMDIRRKRIQRWLFVFYFSATAAAGLIQQLSGKEWQYMIAERQTILESALAAVGVGILPGICCLLVSFLTRESLGYGDSLLILICGLGMGMTECLRIVMTALAGAATWGIILILTKRADKKKEIPFVPFMLLGTVAGMIQA